MYIMHLHPHHWPIPYSDGYVNSARYLSACTAKYDIGYAIANGKTLDDALCKFESLKELVKHPIEKSVNNGTPLASTNFPSSSKDMVMWRGLMSLNGYSKVMCPKTRKLFAPNTLLIADPKKTKFIAHKLLLAAISLTILAITPQIP